MRNQTNPKPLGLSMAKLVLILCVIFSLGAVLGVARYLVANKPKTDLPVMPPGQEKVTISTDKTEYEQGENVIFSIKNNTSYAITIKWPYCIGKIGDIGWINDCGHIVYR